VLARPRLHLLAMLVLYALAFLIARRGLQPLAQPLLLLFRHELLAVQRLRHIDAKLARAHAQAFLLLSPHFDSCLLVLRGAQLFAIAGLLLGGQHVLAVDWWIDIGVLRARSRLHLFLMLGAQLRPLRVCLHGLQTLSVLLAFGRRHQRGAVDVLVAQLLLIGQVQLVPSPRAILIASTVDIAVAVELLLGASRLLSRLALIALLAGSLAALPALLRHDHATTPGQTDCEYQRYESYIESRHLSTFLLSRYIVNTFRLVPRVQFQYSYFYVDRGSALGRVDAVAAFLI